MSGTAGQASHGLSLAQVATSVGLLFTLLTVIFLLVPGIKPEAPPSPPPVTRGEIVEIATDQEESLNRRAFAVSVQLKGYRNRKCRLDAALHREDRSWLGLKAYIDPSARIITPDAQTYRSSVRVTAHPPRSGRYYVRFILYDDKGIELHRRDGPVFAVLLILRR